MFDTDPRALPPNQLKGHHNTAEQAIHFKGQLEQEIKSPSAASDRIEIADTLAAVSRNWPSLKSAILMSILREVLLSF